MTSNFLLKPLRTEAQAKRGVVYYMSLAEQRQHIENLRREADQLRVKANLLAGRLWHDEAAEPTEEFAKVLEDLITDTLHKALDDINHLRDIETVKENYRRGTWG